MPGVELGMYCRDCGDAQHNWRSCDNLCPDCAARARARRVACLAERLELGVPLFDTPPAEVAHAERIVYASAVRQQHRQQLTGTAARTRRLLVAHRLLGRSPMRAWDLAQTLGWAYSTIWHLLKNSPWFAQNEERCWSLTDTGRAAARAG